VREFELVVPAYNEAKNLNLLVERAIAAAKKFGFTAAQFNLILVNNGSVDNSQEVIDTLLNSDQATWITPVQIKINQGYGYGILQGLNTTKANFVGWSHADLQCAPEDAFRCLEIIKKNNGQACLAKGVRLGRDWKDRFVSRVFETLGFLILGVKFYEVNAQPKIFQRDLLQALKNPPPNFAFDLYVLYQALKLKYQIKTIEVQFPPRIHGVSNWAANFAGRYKTILGMIKFMWDLRRSEGAL
jgi:glycosyltransferase involved in cell wall biosynthesis